MKLIREIAFALLFLATPAYGGPKEDFVQGDAWGQCRPIAPYRDKEIAAGATWTKLSPEQWQLARGMYFGRPPTVRLPYGDGAYLLKSTDAGGVVVFTQAEALICDAMVFAGDVEIGVLMSASEPTLYGVQQ